MTITPHRLENRFYTIALNERGQITSLFEDFTVLENAVLAAIGAKRHAFRFWRPMLESKDAVAIAENALDMAGLAMRANASVSELGYGERRQLELAMALAAQPKFLLLDEPMAGMSVQESAAVTNLLRQLKGRYAIVLVEQDVKRAAGAADRVYCLLKGRVTLQGPARGMGLDQLSRAYFGA